MELQEANANQPVPAALYPSPATILALTHVADASAAMIGHMPDDMREGLMLAATGKLRQIGADTYDIAGFIMKRDGVCHCPSYVTGHRRCPHSHALALWLRAEYRTNRKEKE